MIQILLVEDDQDLNQLIAYYLKRANYEVTTCSNGMEALKMVLSSHFDLVISDIMMPGMDGFGLATKIREIDPMIPILFISALEDQTSKKRGFELGIDDYLVKPFDIDELVLRVSALLRRAKLLIHQKISVGNLILDKEEHMAYVNGEELTLTVREFDLLFRLLSTPKKTFTRSDLMEEFWGFDSSATSRTVDVYMAKLREKTKDCDGFDIVTVHGLGYKAVLR
ncbi:MAG: response regulator transcription factor [Prevotella sp.]|nr:response regulator transcription factor [Staphylococcus sp.]MCM1351058.1 response regulator transcription factor [Prevotella sp.]